MLYHTPKPFFRKDRGRWYVQLLGKQYNLGADKEAAFKAYHRLMANPPEPQTVHAGPTEQSSLRIDALCDQFLGWLQTNRAPDTFEWYRYRLQRFIDKYPSMLAKDLRPFHVEQWVADYKLSTTSRRNYFRSVKRCLQWAERQGYLDKSPIAALEVPSAERKEVYVTPEEFDRLLRYVADPRTRELLVLTYTTGCRPQESLRVENRHVDLNHNRWVFPQSEAKCKKGPRIVYLTDEALAVTKRLYEPKRPHQRLFRNSADRPWTTEAINCFFDRLQERMGKQALKDAGYEVPPKEIDRMIAKLNPTCLVKGTLHTKSKAELKAEAKRKLLRTKARSAAPRYCLYALRHSWATNALKAGVDALTVAILMGHRDPSMLARTYQHLGHSPEHMFQQAQKAVGKLQ